MPVLLGVLKTGAGYLPLDPEHPPARIGQTCRGAGVTFVVTDTGSVPPPVITALSGSAELVCVERDHQRITACPARPLSVPTGGRDLAYVIYTSGSTGDPKGAMNEHRAVVNRLRWMQAAMPLAPGEGVLQKTPVGFDVSVWELFWPLLVGGRCVLARPGGHRDPGYLADVIVESEVRVVHFVPSMLDAFLTHPDLTGCAATLRHLVCSGEELTRTQVAEARRRFPETEIHNLYGPTEAAVDVSWQRVREETVRIPIGRPISGVRLYVVDHHFRPVPVGVPGELLIGGEAVGRGYWRNPARSADRFIPDPFGPPGGRVYRTGDVVRWLASGELEFRGRIDHQVKIRGSRVEPGEVESLLTDHPMVQSAAVRAVPGGDGARLVAYVQLTPATAAAWASAPESADRDRAVTSLLRAHLRELAPVHLIPDSVSVLSQWPLSPNGKLDRSRLPEPPPPRATAGYLAPRTPLERQLADIWAEVLERERVGVEDDLFDLGGHSLVAIRLISRVRAEFGVELSPAAVFAAPTVAGMSAAIEAAPAAARPAALSAVRRVDRRRYRTELADPGPSREDRP